MIVKPDKSYTQCILNTNNKNIKLNIGQNVDQQTLDHNKSDSSKCYDCHVTPKAYNYTDKHSLDLSLSEEKDHNSIKGDQQYTNCGSLVHR